VSPKLPLGLILGQRPGVAVAYVAEHDRARIHAGDAVLLVPTSPEQSRLSGRVTSIDPAPIRRLTDPAVAATNGGAIPVRADSQGLIPEGAWTRLSITLDEPSPATEQPAAALISGRAESPLARALRAALVVLVREWGT
jgi:putative peptide zinc metalloprotease protein